MSEIWKEIPYANNYEVSTLGNVRNKRTNHIVKQRIGRDGRYLVVDLYTNGKRLYKRVHRLVADTFLDNPNGFSDVNHIDGNRLNNTLANLEYCSHLSNMKHAYVHGLITPWRKMSDEQIQFIKDNYIPYSRSNGARALARKLGVAKSTILYHACGGGSSE